MTRFPALLVAHTQEDADGENMKKKLTKEQREEIQALQQLPDEEIDCCDIPEVTDWSKAVVGRFYRPVDRSSSRRIEHL